MMIVEGERERLKIVEGERERLKKVNVDKGLTTWITY